MRARTVLLAITLGSWSVLCSAQELPSRRPDHRTELLKLYSNLDRPEGQQLYSRLPVETRQQLWSLHLRRALKEVPDLSARQRAVILQGLGFLSTGGLSIQRDHPEWERLVVEQLDHLKSQAKEVFDPALARAIFGAVGGGISMSSPAPCAATGSIAAPLIIPDCSCSRESDWCDWVTNPSPICREKLCREQNSGCGTFWAYDSDGICGA